MRIGEFELDARVHPHPRPRSTHVMAQVDGPSMLVGLLAALVMSTGSTRSAVDCMDGAQPGDPVRLPAPFWGSLTALSRRCGWRWATTPSTASLPTTNCCAPN